MENIALKLYRKSFIDSTSQSASVILASSSWRNQIKQARNRSLINNHWSNNRRIFVAHHHKQAFFDRFHSLNTSRDVNVAMTIQLC